MSSRPVRGDQPERTFQWFEPKRRRATLYEDVTVDSQPSITRHLDRGWPVHFEDGRGTWWEDSTELESSDWYAFRDPGQLWERTYYQQGTAYEAADRRCRPDRAPGADARRLPPRVGGLPAGESPGPRLRRARALAGARERGSRLPVGYDRPLRRARGRDEAAPGAGAAALRARPRGVARGLPGGPRAGDVPGGRGLAAGTALRGATAGHLRLGRAGDGGQPVLRAARGVAAAS